VFGRSVRADHRERIRWLPGDELVANPVGSVTHAITIERAPREVWPWLIQRGAGRAGWYSYDLIDNEEQEPGRTRLIERGRVRSPYRRYGLPEWLAKRLAPLAHAIFVRKHLNGIASRAEAAGSGRAAGARS
jgi:hypothetical protein